MRRARTDNGQPRRLLSTVQRALVGACFAAAATVGLAWLVAEHPGTARVVAVLAALSIAVSAMRILRDDRRLQRAASVAIAGIGSLIGIAAVNAAVDDAGERTAAEASAVSPSDERELELVQDPEDCDACAGEIIGIGSSTSDAERVVVVELASRPAADDELFVWRVGAPTGPLHVRFADDGWTVMSDPWHSVGRVIGEGDTVELRLSSTPEGIAVVSGGGDRAPDVGHLMVDGTVEVVDTESGVEEAVAATQSGYPGLDEPQRALASALLGRQLRTGTTRVVTRTAEGAASEVTITTEYPQLSQVSVGPDGRTVALYALVDGIRSCVTAPGGAPECEEAADLGLPAGVAAVLAADPAAVRVRRLPEVEEPGTYCVEVESDVDDGPTPGRSCWMLDGTLVAAARDDGVTTELVGQEATIDAALLRPPQETA